MKNFRSVLYILLVLALLLLVSCSSETTDLSGHTVVRADATHELVTKASVQLKNTINEVCKTNIAITTDWVGKEEIPSDTLEILVGNTNRRSAVGLNLGDYEIIMENGRIYLLGGSPEAVVAAVDYFTENLLTSRGAKMTEGFVYKHSAEYELDGITINGEPVSHINMTVPSSIRSAGSIAWLIKEKAGIGVSESTAERDDSNIILTNKAGYGIQDGNYGVVCENGRIYVVGRTELEMKSAVNAFADIISSSTGTLSVNDGIIVNEHQLTRDEYNSEKHLIIYPEFDDRILRDYTYDVSVTQGNITESLPVYNHIMDNYIPSRSRGGDLYRRFSAFAFSGERVRVDIKVKQDFDSYTVYPSAKGLKSEFKDGVISVYLDKPEYFGIRLDDDMNSILTICADYPEFPPEMPDRNDPNVMYIEGWYETESGLLEITDNDQIIYIAPGAVLNARLKIFGDRCKVMGRGAMVDPFENYYEYDGNNTKGTYMLSLVGSNATVDGIFILDPRTYNLTIHKSNNHIRNLKCFSSMMCSDGISIWGGENNLIEDCFLYVGDNAMVTGGANSVFRNILVGTTCSVIFPQNSPSNEVFENIYIFRAGEGAVSNIYNGTTDEKPHQTVDVKIKNLDAMDCTYLPRLFRGGDMGVLDKSISFENISLPLPTGSSIISENGGNHLIDFENYQGDEYTENYNLSLKNLYIDGKLADGLEDFKIKNAANAENTVTVTSDETANPVIPNTHTVNYIAPDKIFIGELQIFTQYPCVMKNDMVMLPYSEIKAWLRSDKSAKTEMIGEVEYINAQELVDSGLAADCLVNENRDVILTPVYNGENLLLEDVGEISKYNEAISYQEELTIDKDDNGSFLKVQNIRSSGAGIVRFITNEMKMYGAGKYKITFSARAWSNGNIKLSVISEKNIVSGSKVYSLTNKWQDFELEFDMRGIVAKKPMTVISMTASKVDIEQFDVRDITLTKVE